MSKPVIHVALDQEELQLLTEVLDEELPDYFKYEDHRAEPLRLLLNRLQDEFMALARLSNTAN